MRKEFSQVYIGFLFTFSLACGLAVMSGEARASDGIPPNPYNEMFAEQAKIAAEHPVDPEGVAKRVRADAARAPERDHSGGRADGEPISHVRVGRSRGARSR